MSYNENLSTVMTLLYMIGCSLTGVVIYSCYPHIYTGLDQEIKRILLFLAIVTESFLWTAAAFLAKVISQLVSKEDEPKVVATVYITTALLSYAAALCLYLRYLSLSRLVREFEDLVGSLEDHLTEFGHSDHIQELQLEHTSNIIRTTQCRSCPNLTLRTIFKLKTH